MMRLAAALLALMLFAAPALAAVPPPVRVAFAAALVVAFLALAGGGLVTASANALPGDPLYGVPWRFAWRVVAPETPSAVGAAS